VQHADRPVRDVTGQQPDAPCHTSVKPVCCVAHGCFSGHVTPVLSSDVVTIIPVKLSLVARLSLQSGMAVASRPLTPLLRPPIA
jgi:hypothetical protein